MKAENSVFFCCEQCVFMLVLKIFKFSNFSPSFFAYFCSLIISDVLRHCLFRLSLKMVTAETSVLWILSRLGYYESKISLPGPTLCSAMSISGQHKSIPRRERSGQSKRQAVMYITVRLWLLHAFRSDIHAVGRCQNRQFQEQINPRKFMW